MRFQSSIARILQTVVPALLLVFDVGLLSLWAQHGPHGPENGLNTPANAQGQIASKLQNLGSHAFRIKTRARRA